MLPRHSCSPCWQSKTYLWLSYFSWKGEITTVYSDDPESSVLVLPRGWHSLWYLKFKKQNNNDTLHCLPLHCHKAPQWESWCHPAWQGWGKPSNSDIVCNLDTRSHNKPPRQLYLLSGGTLWSWIKGIPWQPEKNKQKKWKFRDWEHFFSTTHFKVSLFPTFGRGKLLEYQNVENQENQNFLKPPLPGAHQKRIRSPTTCWVPLVIRCNAGKKILAPCEKMENNLSCSTTFKLWKEIVKRDEFLFLKKWWRCSDLRKMIKLETRFTFL